MRTNALTAQQEVIHLWSSVLLHRPYFISTLRLLGARCNALALIRDTLSGCFFFRCRR